jgi:hypothetical protein
MFRDGRYHKTVKIGKRRVKDGECCAIWDSMGRVRNVVGPQREWIWWSDVRFLDRFVANQAEYLVVEFRDGRKEHVRGPASLFQVRTPSPTHLRLPRSLTPFHTPSRPFTPTVA